MTDSIVSSKPKQYTLCLSGEGTLTLPEAVLQQFNLKQGDRLRLTLKEDGTLQLQRLPNRFKALRGILKDKAPNCNLVEELIHERRQEAIRESLR